MTFDDWFDSHYQDNDDPLFRKAEKMKWDDMAAAMRPAYPNYGWLCPRCGRGNAPGTMTCSCVPMVSSGWTSTPPSVAPPSDPTFTC